MAGPKPWLTNFCIHHIGELCYWWDSTHISVQVGWHPGDGSVVEWGSYWWWRVLGATGAVGSPGAGPHQVWSLTQFYAVGFPQSRISVKKCVFHIHTIKVCVSWFLRYSGTSASSLTNLTVSLFLWSSGSNVWCEVVCPWRAPCELNKPLKD